MEDLQKNFSKKIYIDGELLVRDERAAPDWYKIASTGKWVHVVIIND